MGDRDPGQQPPQVEEDQLTAVNSRGEGACLALSLSLCVCVCVCV